MSDALAQFGTIARTAANLGALVAFGSTGGVSLGLVELRDFEVPETVTFGTTQAMAVHRLPGGQRVIDSMGPDPSSVVWQGFMLGPDAVDRAEALHALAKLGELLDLRWGEYDYGVIVASFECDYRRSNWVGEYRISCTVVPDPPPDDQTVLLPAETVGNEIGAAQGVGLPPAFADAGASLATAQRALGLAGALVPGTASALRVVGALGQARDLLQIGVGVAEVDMMAADASADGFGRTLDAAGRLATGSAALAHVRNALVGSG